MTYGDDAFRLLDGGGGRGRRGHLVKFHYLVPMQCSLPLLNGVDFYYMGQELRESRVALHLAACARARFTQFLFQFGEKFRSLVMSDT